MTASGSSDSASQSKMWRTSSVGSLCDAGSTTSLDGTSIEAEAGHGWSRGSSYVALRLSRGELRQRCGGACRMLHMRRPERARPPAQTFTPRPREHAHNSTRTRSGRRTSQNERNATVRASPSKKENARGGDEREGRSRSARANLEVAGLYFCAAIRAWRRRLSSSGPRLLMYWRYAPSLRMRLSALASAKPALFMLVKPHFLETMIFWRPANL